MELPKFQNFTEVTNFFSNSKSLYYAIYHTVMDLKKYELLSIYEDDQTLRKRIRDWFVKRWNSFVEEGIPQELPLEKYPASSVLLAKLMNDIKKEV
jgi:hypothetical protein